MYWLDKISAIFIILILNVILTFVGKFLLDIFKIRLSSYFESIIAAFGLGAGVAGLSIFLIGALFNIRSLTLAIFLIILSFVAIIQIWIEHKSLLNIVKKLKLNKFDLSKKLLFIFTIFLFLHSLYRGIWPDIDFDSLWYHLTEPKLYLMWEKVKFIRGGLLYYSAMPQLVEMLYILGLFLKGAIGAKLIHAFFGFWCFALAFLWGRDLTKKDIGGFIAGLIFYASNIVFWESRNAYIDLAVTFYVSLGLFFYLKFLQREKTDNIFLIISAIFLGFAIGAKLLSAYFVLIVFLINIVSGIFSKFNIKRLFSGLIIVLIIPLLLWLPWGIYSFIKTNNPFYPMFEGMFNKIDWFSASQMSGMSMREWVWVQFKNLFKFPGNILNEEYGFPVVMVFGFFAAVLTFFRERKVKTAALIFLLFTILWNFTPARGDRFYLPITLMMSVFASYFLTKIYQKGLHERILITSIVIFSSISQLLNFYFMFTPNVWVISAETEEEFLKQNVSANIWSFYDYNGRVAEIVKNEKVLVYNIHNLYYLNFNFDDVSYSTVKHELFGNRAEIENYLKLNYSYVLIKRADLTDFWINLGLSELPENLFKLEYEDSFSEIKLYKINK